MEVVVNGFASSKVLPGSDASDENALYLDGLPADCDDIHLYRLCAPFGAIAPSGCAVMKGPDGWCKGSGIVYFLDYASVQSAVTMLHGCVMPDGNPLKATPNNSWQSGKGMQKGGCFGGGADGGMMAGMEAQMAAAAEAFLGKGGR